MTRKSSATLVTWIALLVTLVMPAVAQPAEPAAELDALVTRIQDKLRAGQKSAADLAPDVAALDALRARYESAGPKVAAQAAEMEYRLCRDVLRDQSKAAELRRLLATKYRRYLDETTEGELGREEAHEKLVGKPAPELKFIWSTQPGLKKLSDLKGKVVVLDFWATWCAPCIATFPQIRELVEHYRNADVIVVGITSLQGFVSGLEPPRIDTRNDPAKEFALMPRFIEAKAMTWTIAFSEGRVFDPRYGVQGIPHMAILAPDGTVRHNGLHPGMPHAGKVALIDALLKEFGRSPAVRSAGN